MMLTNNLRLIIIITVTAFIFSTASAKDNATDAAQTAAADQSKENVNIESSTDAPETEASSATQSSTDDSGESQPSESQQPESTQADQKKSDTNRRIARAQFTTGIVDREPTDDVVLLTNNQDKIYFFTELINFEGQTVKHRWEYEGQEMAVIDINVEGPRWRAHTSKNIKPEWTGIWSVTVYDGDNRPLKITSFEVVDANTGN